jgi:hypothetical protein
LGASNASCAHRSQVRKAPDAGAACDYHPPTGTCPLRDLERMVSEIAGWHTRQPQGVRYARMAALRQASRPHAVGVHQLEPREADRPEPPARAARHPGACGGRFPPARWSSSGRPPDRGRRCRCPHAHSKRSTRCRRDSTRPSSSLPRAAVCSTCTTGAAVSGRPRSRPPGSGGPHGSTTCARRSRPTRSPRACPYSSSPGSWARART